MSRLLQNQVITGLGSSQIGPSSGGVESTRIQVKSSWFGFGWLKSIMSDIDIRQLSRVNQI